ncbi:MAG: adenylate/guanylate cyclase domain-containing protein [Candidatus Kapaibacterium sp.]
MKNILLIISVLLALTNTSAQNQRKIDSLTGELRKFEVRKQSLGTTATAMIDTVKADILFEIIWNIRNINADTIPTFALPCLEISQKLGYKKGMANAFTGMGIYYNGVINYPRCLESHQKALALRREIGDTKGISYSLNQIGIALLDLGNHAGGLSSFLEALKYAQLAGDSVDIARCFCQLAGMYLLQDKNADALNYYLRAAAMLENNKGKESANLRLMSAYEGIAGIYSGMTSKTQEAIEYYRKALLYAKETGSNYYIVSLMGALGIAYQKHGDYPKAIEIVTSALQVFNSANFDNSRTDVAERISWLTGLIGTSYERLGNLKKALQYQKQALTYALRAGPGSQAPVFEELATIYRKMGDYKNAYEYHVKAEAMKDSVAKSINREELNKIQIQNEFTKIQDSTKAEQVKKDAVAEQELQKQKLTRNGFIAGFVVVLLFAGVFFRQRNKISKQKEMVELEKHRSDNLLLNILPAEVAEELKAKGTADAKLFDNVTVLFTDFKSFTTVSEQLSPQELVNELHACFKAFDEICGKYSIEKIKTIGDAYLAVCGLPQANEKHAENVVHAALEIREFMVNRSKELGAKTFEIRIGINSGSVVAGIVGVKKFAYDIWGDTVNTAARMEQHSEAGKINISETTYALVKDQFACEYRGEIDAKNKGKLTMYFVEPRSYVYE